MDTVDSSHTSRLLTAEPLLDPPEERSLATAVDRAAHRLLALQQEDGHWCAELEGDSILESEYILTQWFLGRTAEDKLAKAARHLRASQEEDGGWCIYPGGAPDVNPTVKAYFALKLAGDPPSAPHMQKALEVARRLGGIDACNSFTRIYMAVFGQYPWARCPAVPPEIILLPSWFPFNIYEMSSWSRAIVVPLSIIWALKPHCDVPEALAVPELLVTDPVNGSTAADSRQDSLSALAWSKFFRGTDAALKVYEKAPFAPLRRLALERAREWIVQRLDRSDGLGAIFPPIVNTIYAFRALGMAIDDPLLAGQIEQLERLEIEDEHSLRIQPCFSPVWDTALALHALLEAGLAPDAPEAERAASWLLEREVTSVGDWSVKSGNETVGGWFFEYANEFYPDCDDTAQVVTTLSGTAFGDRPQEVGEGGHGRGLGTAGLGAARVEAALDRGVAWLRGMQNRDGGWASFDKDCDREFLKYVPFADHNAMVDPATVDITARVLEAFAARGIPRSAPELRRAVRFIRGQQEADGSWFGRWGCNYLYGTWLGLWGLRKVGERPGDPALRRGGEWLLSCQNRDGGWGELPDTYRDAARKGEGPSTASQTAWALLGLAAADLGGSDSANAGVAYLLEHQEAEGGWSDAFWTGTGFPEVFYLRYHLYATYFPLLALATYRRLADGIDPFAGPLDGSSNGPAGSTAQ